MLLIELNEVRIEVNVLVLFSSSDKLFEEAGYLYPKNLIEINEKPLIQHVLECFKEIFDDAEQVIFAIKKNETERFYTAISAKLLYPEAIIVDVPNVTRGAACTALLASKYIDNDNELLILNGDILVDESISEAIEVFRKERADGGALTFESVHPRWSFIKCDAEGYMIEAAEKRPISNEATIGVYYYRRGNDFVEAAKQSIRKDADVNGYYYICPVFNELILKQKKLLTYKINKERYHSLATPQGVAKYQGLLEDRNINENR